MSQSTKLLTAAALTGFALMVGGLSMTILGGSANALESVGQASETASARIAGAFAVVPQVPDANVAAAVAQSRKGDLGADRNCGNQKWPQITADCLVAADGTAKRPVRAVTIGYQTGENSSVLIRMPAPQIASR